MDYRPSTDAELERAVNSITPPSDNNKSGDGALEEIFLEGPYWDANGKPNTLTDWMTLFPSMF